MWNNVEVWSSDSTVKTCGLWFIVVSSGKCVAAGSCLAAQGHAVFTVWCSPCLLVCCQEHSVSGFLRRSLTGECQEWVNGVMNSDCGKTLVVR